MDFTSRTRGTRRWIPRQCSKVNYHCVQLSEHWERRSVQCLCSTLATSWRWCLSQGLIRDIGTCTYEQCIHCLMNQTIHAHMHYGKYHLIQVITRLCTCNLCNKLPMIVTLMPPVITVLFYSHACAVLVSLRNHYWPEYTHWNKRRQCWLSRWSLLRPCCDPTWRLGNADFPSREITVSTLSKHRWVHVKLRVHVNIEE